MTDKARGGRRFLAVDSLRGLCACMVAIGHMVTPAHIRQLPFFHSSYLFVDFFFVLSGFVIAASYGAKLAGGFPAARFLGLRLGRVYPMHALVLLVMLAMELAFLVLPGLLPRQPFDAAHSVWLLVASLLMIHIFVGPDVTPWNAVSWSIAAELWTYLLFAPLFRLHRARLIAASLAIAGAGFAWAFLTTDRGLNLYHDGSFARCVYGFGLGVVGHALFERLDRRAGSGGAAVWTAAEVLLVIASGAIASLGMMDKRAFAAPPLFLLVVVCFALERGAVSRLLKLRPFLFVGTLSYSIYMIHHFIQLRAGNVLAMLGKATHGRVQWAVRVGADDQIGLTPWQGDVLVVAIMATVIGVAWLTYRYVEHPARTWSRKIVMGSRARPSVLMAEREAPTF